jgi:hypothetical protein
MKTFTDVVAWAAGPMAVLAIGVVITLLSIAAYDRWRAWRKS